jgi:hypothetical protein
MSATLIAWPAAWLMFGQLIARALQRDRLALGTWLTASLLALIFLTPKSIPTRPENWGSYSTAFAAIMKEHQWVLWQTVAALTAGILFVTLKFPPKAHGAAVGISTLATTLLAITFWKTNHAPGYLKVAAEVTQINATNPNFQSVGQFAATLPQNAAFLVIEQSRLENKLVEFSTDRSCYPTTPENWQSQARQLEQAGALPYLLTPGPRLPLPIIYVDVGQGRTIYACIPSAQQAARTKPIP